VRVPIAIAFLAWVQPLPAQMPWTIHLPQRGAAIDILRPKLQGGGSSLTTFAVYLSGRLPLGGTSSLRFELPFALASDASSSTIGNPYIGVEDGHEKGLSFEAGLRGPLTSETEFPAAEIGAYSDVTRFEAFVPNSAVLSARARYRFTDTSGFIFEAGGGPSGLIPTKGGNAELILHHHMWAGYRGTDAWMAVGFGGWTIITEDGTIARRTIHQVGGSLGLSSGSVRPAFHVIVPLNANSEVGVVLGFGVAIAAK